MNVLVLLQSSIKPSFVKDYISIVASYHLGFKSMFQADFAPILLPDESSNNGTAAISERVTRDVIGDCEEDKRVEKYMEARIGGFVGGDEWIGRHHRGVLLIRRVNK